MSRPPPDPLFVLRGSEGAVNTLSFHQDQTHSRDWLISGCSSGKVSLWDLKTRRVGETLDGHSGQGIIWSQWLPNNTLLSQGRDNKIQQWDHHQDGFCQGGSIRTDTCSFCRTAVVQQGNNYYLALPSGTQSEILVYDLDTKKKVHSLVPKEGNTTYGMVMALHCYLGSGGQVYVLAGYEDGYITAWLLPEHKVVSRLKAHQEPVICLDYSQSQSKGVTGSADNKVCSWTFHQQTELKIENQTDITNSGISDIKIRNDNKVVATAGWDTRIRLFGCKSLKPLAVLSYHGDSIHSLAFGSQTYSSKPSELLLAAGSKDKHISFWSIYN